jgi:hypothetical protein
MALHDTRRHAVGPRTYTIPGDVTWPPARSIGGTWQVHAHLINACLQAGRRRVFGCRAIPLQEFPPPLFFEAGVKKGRRHWPA